MDERIALLQYDIQAGYPELDQGAVDFLFTTIMHLAHDDAEFAFLANTVDYAMLEV